MENSQKRSLAYKDILDLRGFANTVDNIMNNNYY